MKTRNTILRACAVGALTLGLALLALWSTGNFPPVVLANSGGSVTYRTLTKCTPTGGTILNSPTGTTFVNNTVVTLTADPIPGYDFSAWTGAITGSTNPVNLTMNANKSVCATFVADSTLPTITLLGTATVYVECGGAYSDAGATANDNRDGDITARIVVGGDTVNVNTPGTYTITYNVQDDAENAAQVTRTVIVQDTGVPVITLLGSNPVDTPLGGTYTDAGATALDGCGGDLTGAIVVAGDTVNSNALGDYVITYNVEDAAGNDAVQVTRTVHVKDMTPPVITLSGDNPLDIHLGDTYTDPGATALDNLDGDLTLGIAVGGDTVDIETAGVYSVTYNVTDAAGNAAVEVIREVRIWPSLEIAVVGTGSTSPASDEVHFVEPGSTVELTGFADNEEHIFLEWTGDAVADSNSAVTTIVMDGPKSVTAHFVEGHTVLRLVGGGLGSIEAVPNKAIYHDGAQVAFTATPESGYEFDRWETDGTLVSGTVDDPAITLALNDDAILTAYFTQLSYTLAASVTGNGTVSPNSGSYHHGDPLTLTATPDSGWYFAYWTGGLTGTESPKSLDVTGSITTTAVFVEHFTLTVQTEGNGSVSPGTATYIPGDPVTLTPTASSGWRFDHWEGDFDSQDSPLNLTMHDNYTVTAVFVEDKLLTVSTIGEGTVTLSPTQPVDGYLPGTNVTLTAVPASGWLFEGWSGGLSSSANPKSLTTPAASEIVAEFREATTLTITTAGTGGTVQVTDGVRTYTAQPGGIYTVPLGTTLSLTPTATSGCFYQWSGDLTGFDAPGMLTVAGDHAVTAEFGMKATLELSVVGEGSITLDPPQPVGGYCPGTEVTVTAVPDADWAFSQWGAGLPNLSWSPSQTFRPTPGPTDIAAFFVARPGIASLDLVSDLGAWLVALGVYTDPEEVEAYDYDQGSSDLVDLETVYLPNGIPDAAELWSLQVVLQHPAIEVKDGGVSHAQVWRIYQTCLAQAQVDLIGQSAAVQRGLAAYMTLGTFPHVGRVLEEVQTHFGVTLDRSLYPNAGDRWFGTDKDMDGDGATNKQEWDYAVAQTAEAKSGSPSAAAEAYAGAGPDPGARGGAPAPLPETGDPADFFSEYGSPPVKLKVLPSVNLTVTARVTTPDGSKVLVLEEGEDADLPAGVEVRVEASDAAWFSYWHAPNSLLSGSESPKDSFILTGSTEIWGMTKGSSSFEFPDNAFERVSVSVAGGDEPLVLARGPGLVGNSYIEVREGTLLSVQAPQSPYYDTWLRFKLARREMTYAGRQAVIEPSDVENIILSGGIVLHGYGTSSVSGSNGIPTISMSASVKIDPFVNGVRYAIPYAPGVAWDMGTSPTFVPERSSYVYDIDAPRATNANPNPTAQIDVRPMSVLTVNPAECGQECTQTQHGWASIENAKRYYLGPRASTPNAELVGIWAIANPGHVVKGLKVEGGGQVWRLEDLGGLEDYYNPDDWVPAVPNEEGLYVGEDLSVEMTADATVTPVVCPCIHHGTVNDGRLEGDTKLEKDTGFDTFSENRYGCLLWTLKKVRRIGESWAATHDYIFQVGRISQAGGGSYTPEGQLVEGSSHRNGLDVDVRYIRKNHDGSQLNVVTSPSAYDQEATQELVDKFVAEGAKLIITTSAAGLDTGSAQRLYLDGHNDHFHVRFKDPDGESN